MDSKHLKKYRNAVLYLIKNCNNQYLGDTKLNKLLYYLDFISRRDYKKTVTGDTYLHLEFGPVPKRVREVVSVLLGEGKIGREEMLLEGGGHKIKYKTKANPAMSVFTKSEQNLLKKVCDTFKEWDTKKMVAQTHLEAPWFYSTPGEKINYKYAADIDIL